MPDSNSPPPPIDPAAATASPLTVTVDGQTVTQHNLKDVIAAAEFAANQQVARNPARALRLSTLAKPGAQ